MSEPVELVYSKVGIEGLPQFSEVVMSNMPSYSVFTTIGLGILEIFVRGRACPEYSAGLFRSFNEALEESKQYLSFQEDLDNFEAIGILVGVLKNDADRIQVNEWLHEWTNDCPVKRKVLQ